MTTSLQKSTIHRTVLNNGIVVLMAENPTADIVAARIFVRAGSCYESQEQAGLGHLLSTVLTKGCDGLSSLEIAERIEFVGASLSADTTADYFLVSLKTVTADFGEILSLAGRILRSPTFPEAEVELEKRIALQDIRSQQEQPFTVAVDKLRLSMYQNHPYALSVLGTEASMSSLNRNDIVQAHQTYFRPDNVVISIVGRITPANSMTLVEEIFGDWQAPVDQPVPKLNLPNLQVQPQSTITPLTTQQSIVTLGYLGPSADSHDYAALKLMSTYLGNGLSSRLFVELREKRGLAYEVSAFYPTRLFPASFVVYMGTAPENTKIAFSGLKAEVDLLSSVQLDEDSLQTAKNKILGQYALGKQTNAQIAQLYGWYEILGLGIDFDRKFQEMIASVSAVDVIEAAYRYLREPYVSLVGPQKAITSALP
ncbi:insulinase family protein [Aetokthonos hydrillicola Thurmond2011]|jgi:predicted Zn-dependent peptidase|uniref:Insulinase family protein n=1 Tax=Aetokthonos hydrillicola Thurmond2011 TaxID=2712845 RepID=A0AAP5I4N6_9CYAN|nr:pitrilysin family protein [Aetokthonos hydrillicola]MBO3462283.1 insulinase family protein [Aetokthonos hydrillicola CCALA 1050]MBW4589474.1 insulinase family protein [Aetokthonos hydrillicola CCALA 1050]MDR9893682.1 insulinase family protein [Aetokthonos hydrillicola Thurmond2011]